jgi:hypothetical protein
MPLISPAINLSTILAVDVTDLAVLPMLKGDNDPWVIFNHAVLSLAGGLWSIE